MNVQLLLEEFVKVLRNPAEEPVRAALVAALLFVAFVVVALLVLIAVPPRRDEEEADWFDETADETASPSRLWKNGMVLASRRAAQAQAGLV